MSLCWDRELCTLCGISADLTRKILNVISDACEDVKSMEGFRLLLKKKAFQVGVNLKDLREIDHVSLPAILKTHQ